MKSSVAARCSTVVSFFRGIYGRGNGTVDTILAYYRIARILNLLDLEGLNNDGHRVFSVVLELEDRSHRPMLYQLSYAHQRLNSEDFRVGVLRIP